MAFDLGTATPVASGGFDLSSAQPVPAGAGIPGPRRAWSDVPGEALANLESSGKKFVGGLYEAVTSPVQTVKGLLDIGAGALQNALPKQVVDFVNKFDANPQAAQQAVEVANAVGGMYKDRYGSIEGIKNTFATDPVGAVADLSTLLSGGATATARVAPAASRVLATTAAYTNPTAPITAAAGYGAAMTGKAIGNVIDTMQGQRPAIRAGNIISNALTEEGRTPQNLLAAQMALQNAPPTATVRQALSDVMSPQTQYLGQMVEARTAPGAAALEREAQKAARMANLQAVTPDLAVAQAMRGNATTPLYTAATQPTTAVSTVPLIQTVDKILASNPGNVKLTTALNQVKSGLEASTTAEQVSSVLDNLKDLIATKENKFIVKNLLDVKSNVEKALPGYQKAQQVFAATSAPVNQAKVLNAMQDVLASPLGVGERAGPFMTAMGRGEQALLKKATGEARYGGLDEVLTPSQMKVVGEVQSELLRDASVASQTKAGAEAMKIIMDSNKSKVRLPDFMSVKVTLANQMLKILEGKLNQKVMGELENGFNSSTSFVDLMKKIPASERIEVLRALGQAKDQLSPAKLNALGVSANALAPAQQNQNSMITVNQESK